MADPSPSSGADALIDTAAAAIAEAADDGCFDRSMFTEQEWADGAGEEDRDWYRKLARAALGSTLRRVAAQVEAARPSLPPSIDARRERCLAARLAYNHAGRIVRHALGPADEVSRA